MKFKDFKANYGFRFSTVNNGHELTAVTEVIRKKDGVRIGGVTSSFDIFETGIKLQDSQSPISLFEWDWDKLVEQAKRFQLDHFALLIPIEDFYPRNEETETTDLYI